MLSSLFSPLRLGPVELRNRIVSTAHQTTLVHDHLPTDDFVAYHEARARGGAGLIVLEATAPHPSGILTAHELAGYLPEIAAAYRRVGDAVQPPRDPPLRPAAARRPRADRGPTARTRPRAVRDPEPALPRHSSRAAPRRDRGDRPGLRRRCRAWRRRVVSTVSRSPPRTATSWRSSSTRSSTVATTSGRSRHASCSRSCAPSARRRPGCASASASRPTPSRPRVWPRCSRNEVDYLSVALGESPSYLGSTLIVPPPPLTDGAILPHTAAFRVGLPLIATSRIVDVREADAAVAAGDADALGMTRALITDPDLPNKARIGTVAGDHALHRLPGLHRALPRRRRDPLRGQPADRAGTDVARAGAGPFAGAPGRDRRRAGGAVRRRRVAHGRSRGGPGRPGRAAGRPARPRRPSSGRTGDRGGISGQPRAHAGRGRPPPRRPRRPPNR